MSVNYSFYNSKYNYVDTKDLSGLFIVIEGTDGVGRSTQIQEIKNWLELKGYAVYTTGLARSQLIGEIIDQAKKGHNLNVHTYTLLYAADIADRLENDIVPYLRSGHIVIADRYVHTPMVRSIVRGADKKWVEKLFSFALMPFRTIYMKVDVDVLIPRVINPDTLVENYWKMGLGSGMDYWESGMDLKLGEDSFESFKLYQSKVIAELDKYSTENQFTEINAKADFEQVSSQLKSQIEKILKLWK